MNKYIFWTKKNLLYKKTYEIEFRVTNGVIKTKFENFVSVPIYYLQVCEHGQLDRLLLAGH